MCFVKYPAMCGVGLKHTQTKNWSKTFPAVLQLRSTLCQPVTKSTIKVQQLVIVIENGSRGASPFPRWCNLCFCTVPCDTQTKNTADYSHCSYANQAPWVTNMHAHKNSTPTLTVSAQIGHESPLHGLEELGYSWAHKHALAALQAGACNYKMLRD